jgi:hypothetical protein
VPHNARAARSQRKARGYLPLARHCASQEKVGEICASNEQDHGDDCHEDDERVAVLIAQAGDPMSRVDLGVMPPGYSNSGIALAANFHWREIGGLHNGNRPRFSAGRLGSGSFQIFRETNNAIWQLAFSRIRARLCDSTDLHNPGPSRASDRAGYSRSSRAGSIFIARRARGCRAKIDRRNAFDPLGWRHPISFGER